MERILDKEFFARLGFKSKTDGMEFCMTQESLNDKIKKFNNILESMKKSIEYEIKKTNQVESFVTLKKMETTATSKKRKFEKMDMDCE